MIRVALPVKGPAAGKLPVFRISENVTSSAPTLLAIDVANELPGRTSTPFRSKPVPRLGLLIVRKLLLNKAPLPLNVMVMAEVIPGSGQE